MKVPTFVDKTDNGIILAIHWECGCAWDAIIRPGHLPEASGGPGGMKELGDYARRSHKVKEYAVALRDKGTKLAIAEARIRELEAELETSKADGLHYHRWSDEQFARAEKAEARVAELYHHARDEHGCVHVARAE